MKKISQIFLVLIVASFLISLFGNSFSFGYDFMTLFGLLNLIIGGLGLLFTTIIQMTTKREGISNYIAACGLLLLVGIGTCSFFPFRIG